MSEPLQENSYSLLDLKALEQPLTKLAETVKEFANVWIEPKKALKMIDVEIEGNKRKKLAELDLEDAIEARLKKRLFNREINRQENIEAAVKESVHYLPPKVSDEPVSEEFKNHYADGVGDVNNPDLRTLWAKILAGETAQPNTYSLKTLAVLRLMAKKDAELFGKVAQAAVTQADYSFILGANRNIDFLDNELGITFSDILVLRELGLLSSSTAGLHLSTTTEAENFGFAYGDIYIFAERKAGTGKFVLDVEYFTQSGFEMLPLVEIKPNLKYVQKIASYFYKENTTVRYGKIISKTEGNIKVETLKEVSPL